jgi:hypothetical protein
MHVLGRWGDDSWRECILSAPSSTATFGHTEPACRSARNKRVIGIAGNDPNLSASILIETDILEETMKAPIARGMKGAAPAGGMGLSENRCALFGPMRWRFSLAFMLNGAR